MSEEWRPIRETQGRYEISSLGRVRNVRRNRLLSPDLVKGYHRYSFSVDGVKFRRTAHRLIATEWMGDPEPGQVARHVNDEPLDNRPENIRWGSVADNVQDAVRNKKHRNSRKTHCPQGHAYDEENTKVKPNGWRLCVICQAEHTVRSNARKREAR